MGRPRFSMFAGMLLGLCFVLPGLALGGIPPDTSDPQELVVMDTTGDHAPCDKGCITYTKTIELTDPAVMAGPKGDGLVAPAARAIAHERHSATSAVTGHIDPGRS